MSKDRHLISLPRIYSIQTGLSNFFFVSCASLYYQEFDLFFGYLSVNMATNKIWKNALKCFALSF